MNHFGLFGPPTRLVAAQREERLCSVSFLKSTTFFRFAKVFRGDRQSFFSRREERLCSPLLSKSTTFFRFVKLFVSPWSQSFFFNREERLCSPSLQESTVFFVSAKIRFACVSVNRFPLSRGAFMLHPAPQVNLFSSFRQIYFRKQRLFM